MKHDFNEFIRNHSGKPEKDRPQPTRPPQPERPSQPPMPPNREIIKDRPLPDAIEPKEDWDRE